MSAACAPLRVQPERAGELSPAQAPVGMSLGVDYTIARGQGIWEPNALVAKTVRAATRANLFRSVEYATGSEDLTVEAEFSGASTPEAVGKRIGKGLLGGLTFCLLCPFMNSYSDAQASILAFVRDRQGRELARYSFSKQAHATSNIFGELQTKWAAEDSVADQLVAELVSRLAADRESWGKAPAPVARAARPAAPAREDVDSPSYASKTRPDDFALVIGIEDYPGLPKAMHAARDAEAVRAHMKALGVPERNIISLPNATKGKLAAYLEEWLPNNVKPDSRVFFYYSGHGAPDPKTGAAYIVPSDGDPMFLQSTAYPLKDLYAKLAKLPARQVVVALDACFSGAGGRSVLADGARPLVTKTTDVAPTGNISVLAAASGDEITGALDDQGHGMFTYFLLKGLSDGKRSTRDLHSYVKPLVQNEARRQNRAQTPVLLGQSLSF